jgi:DNA-binding PadR family transcriptional regulator
MRSMVSWALLGIVIERPSYGYELALRFERTYGETLEISSRSHIYAALDTLARRGLVEEHATRDGESAARRHPKAHYKATPQGIEGHREWLVSQLAEQRRRSRLFTIQLAKLDPDTALELLERYERYALQQSTRPQATAKREPDAKPEELVERLVAEEERLALDARLAWIEYARQELHGKARPRKGKR